MQPNSRFFSGTSSRFGSSSSSGKLTRGDGRQVSISRADDPFVLLYTSGSHPAVFLTPTVEQQSSRSSSEANPFIHAHGLSEDWEATSTGEVDQPVPATNRSAAPGGFNA